MNVTAPGRALGTGTASFGKRELALAALLPLAALLNVNVGGTLYGQDLAAIVLLPYLLWQPGALDRLGQAKLIFVLIALWFAAQVATDMIVESLPEDYLRGWNKILFLALQFTVLWLLLGRGWRLFIAYMIGEGIWLILQTNSLPPEFIQYKWKFGLGAGLLILAAATGSWLAMRRKSWSPWWLSAAMVGIVSLLALANNARSLFGEGLLAALDLCLIALLNARPALMRKVTPFTFALILVAGVVASQGAIGLYSVSADTGLLGDAALVKYKEQSSGDLSIVQSGRTETLVSLVAIGDSPILGHGSWAHGMEYVRLLHHKLREAGFRDENGEEGAGDLIPTHSHLFGAWVEAGVMGGIFWFGVLAVTVAALYRVHKLAAAPAPIIVVSAFSMLWDVIFSPFGADQRFIRASQLALFLCVIIGPQVRRAGARRIVLLAPRHTLQGKTLTMRRAPPPAPRAQRG